MNIEIIHNKNINLCSIDHWGRAREPYISNSEGMDEELIDTLDDICGNIDENGIAHLLFDLSPCNKQIAGDFRYDFIAIAYDVDDIIDKISKDETSSCFQLEAYQLGICFEFKKSKINELKITVTDNGVQIGPFYESSDFVLGIFLKLKYDFKVLIEQYFPQKLMLLQNESFPFRFP